MNDPILFVFVGGGLIFIAFMVWRGIQQRKALKAFVETQGISNPVWLRENACIGGEPSRLYVLNGKAIDTVSSDDIKTAVVNKTVRKEHVESSRLVINLVSGQSYNLAFPAEGADRAQAKLCAAGLIPARE